MSRAVVPVAKGVPPRFRGIPAVDEGDPGSLWGTVKALVEVVETLTGQRGDTRNKAILLNDLLDDSTDPRKRTELEGIANYLRADDHLALTPPAYTENPHEQYWHKALDPVFSRLRMIVSTGPFSQGDVLKPWLLGPPQPFRAAVDGALGTVAVSGVDKLGVYVIAFSVTFTGTSQGAYQFTLRVNGVLSTITVGTILGVQQTAATLSYTALTQLDQSTTSVLDWVLETASSPCTIERASMSLFRISPLLTNVTQSGSYAPHSFTNGFSTGFTT